MRVAGGSSETTGAEVEAAGAEVAVGAVVEVGSGVEVAVGIDCVGLAEGSAGCRVCATVVERKSTEGAAVTEPPQAVVARRSAAIATVNKILGLIGFIFLLVITVIVCEQNPGNRALSISSRYNRVHVKSLGAPLEPGCANDGSHLLILVASLHRLT